HETAASTTGAADVWRERDDRKRERFVGDAMHEADEDALLDPRGEETCARIEPAEITPCDEEPARRIGRDRRRKVGLRSGRLELEDLACGCTALIEQAGAHVIDNRPDRERAFGRPTESDRIRLVVRDFDGAASLRRSGRVE